jgi:hypothetical protein
MNGRGYRRKLAGVFSGPQTGVASSVDPQTLQGVVVLGMHRSGTSLITRLVSLLGLSLCRDEDLYVGLRANPRGHWESKSLVAFNNRLLEQSGATWFCPPALGAKELSRMLKQHASEALATLENAHPRRPWVWKDPRTCVLLPFWSVVLGGRAAYLLVVRHPLEVSDSLARRNGYSPLVSLALWERYTRQAMLGAAGRPTLVCTYDQVLADPLAWCELLVDFLGELGSSVANVQEAVTGAFAMDDLRHSRRSWSQLKAGSLISPQQAALAEVARVFTVQKSYVAPELPAETPETELIFSEIREHVAGRRGAARRRAGLPARLTIDAGSDPDLEETSVPPVSVVLAGAGEAGALLALGATLPPGSEVLLVGGEEPPANALSEIDAVSLRRIDCDQPPREAEALALGVDAARGAIVLLASAALLRCEEWYVPVTEALAVHEHKVAGVGPVMRFDAGPDRRYFGRVFTSEDLQTRFIAADDSPGFVPAPLLFDAHCAYDRRVLIAAGGVDRGFSSASAAVAELSVRLWRMGFRCCIAQRVEAWSQCAEDQQAGDDAEGLYDRLRIAALHFNDARLEAFTDRASRLSSYGWAAERLAASDIQHRRAVITATCAFPLERYLERFPFSPLV